MLVQGVAEETDGLGDGRRHYRAIDCAACNGMHMVNPKTGKLPSEEDDEGA
jgi:hypothetical protein